MDDIYNTWKKSLKLTQRRRTYSHLDSSLDLDNKKHFKHVRKNLSEIVKHEFLPFIKFVKKEIRYRKDKNGKLIRSRKERPIMYSSHLDAHIYSFYNYLWSNKYEDFLKKEKLEPNTIAYRKIIEEGDNEEKGKNNIDFAKELFDQIKTVGTCSVIIADISKFFDSLNHKVLKDNLTFLVGEKLKDSEYRVLRSVCTYRYILNDSQRENKRRKRRIKKASEYGKFLKEVQKRMRRGGESLSKVVYELGGGKLIKENRTTVGIPQGSCVSGLLANIYMIFFDKNVVRNFPGIFYRRYSDDIAIICSIEKTKEVISFLYNEITRCSLEINSSKVFIAKFERVGDDSVVCKEVINGDGKVVNRKFIDYLGFEYSGDEVKVRSTTLKKAYRKADKKIKLFKLRQTGLNPRKKLSVEDLLKKATFKNTYLKKANRVMRNIAKGVDSQQKKLSKFIRKNKK